MFNPDVSLVVGDGGMAAEEFLQIGIEGLL